MTDRTAWFIDSTEINSDYFQETTIGFVYVITNLITGRKYIGKKLAWFKKTSYKMVTLKNGNKKRKKITKLVPSDWIQYYGSCAELLNDVSVHGYESFRREIIYECNTKSEMSYIEALVQYNLGVLLSDRYYNGIINLRVNKNCICNISRDNIAKLYTYLDKIRE